MLKHLNGFIFEEINMSKPNIVYFVADQMRSDSLHHLGNPASLTPCFDQIVETDAISFENAYCQNPVCVPSRHSFLSGLYPHTRGHRTMHYLTAQDDPNIMKVMKDAGYEVIWVGRNDVIPADQSKAAYCDEYYSGNSLENQVEPTSNTGVGSHSHGHVEPSPELYSFYLGKLDGTDSFSMFDKNCLKSAMDYLDRKAQSGNDKPFLLYVTLTFPHPPYGCEEPYYSAIDRSKLEPRRPDARTLSDKPSMMTSIVEKQGLEGHFDEAWFDELRATYLAMTMRFDEQFGQLMDKLKEHKFYDNTSVFAFSDHGDYTTDYGVAEKAQNLFDDPVSKVPLIIKPSKDFKVKTGVSKALVELADLSATVSEMCQVELPYTQFGKSLVEAIAGNPVHKECVICEGGRIHGETQAMERGHGPESPYWPRLSTQGSEGPEHTKAIMIRMGNYKYTYRLYEKHEFYDLDKDPLELNNSIDHPEYQDQIEKMRSKLLYRIIETGDFVPNKRDKR